MSSERPWLDALRDSSTALQGVLGALLEAERHFAPPASPLERLQQITTSPEWAWLQPLYRLIADLDHALAHVQRPAGERERGDRCARARAADRRGRRRRAGISRALPRAAADRPGGGHGARRGAARAAGAAAGSQQPVRAAARAAPVERAAAVSAHGAARRAGHPERAQRRSPGIGLRLALRICSSRRL